MRIRLLLDFRWFPRSSVGTIMRGALKGRRLNDFDPIRIRVLDERQALNAAVVDRYHAERGNDHAAGVKGSLAE